MSPAIANWMLIRPAHADAAGDGLGRGAQPLDVVAAQGDRGQRAGGVAGVDAGLLDVLHDAAEVELVAVVERVHVDLDGVVEEAVDEHRVFGDQPGVPAPGTPPATARRRRSPCRGRRARRRGGPSPGSRSRRRCPWPARRRRRCRTWARAARPRPAPGRRRRAPRRGGSPRARCRRSGTPLSLSACARPSGVWPPSCTMTPATGPACCSACTISRTSSRVSGSK